MATVNANTPDTISLDATALVMRRRGYDIRTVPWRQVAGWRQRRRLIILDTSDGLEPVVFSTSQLSDVECEHLRGILGSHIRQSNLQ